MANDSLLSSLQRPEQVKAHLLPDVVSAMSELFLINGDLQAMFYTNSRAMHSQSICLLEGNRKRSGRSGGMGVAMNAGVAVQRRFINLLQVLPPNNPLRDNALASQQPSPAFS